PNLLENAQVTLDSTRTRPVKIHGHFKLKPNGSVPDAVKSFMAANAQELAVPFGVGGVKLIQGGKDPGPHTLRYNHEIDGMRVFGAQSIVSVTDDDEIHHMEMYSGPTRMAPQTLAATPGITAQQASDAAAKTLGTYKKRLDGPAPEPVWYPTDA